MSAENSRGLNKSDKNAATFSNASVRPPGDGGENVSYALYHGSSELPHHPSSLHSQTSDLRRGDMAEKPQIQEDLSNLHQLQLEDENHESGNSSGTMFHQKWRESFDRLIDDAEGLKLFQEYLGEENQHLVDFYFGCKYIENFSHERYTLYDYYKSIYMRFVKGNKLELPLQVKYKIVAAMKKKSDDRSVYDDALAVVKERLEKVHYPAFLQSNLFNKYAIAEMESSRFGSSDSSSLENTNQQQQLEQGKREPIAGIESLLECRNEDQSLSFSSMSFSGENQNALKGYNYWSSKREENEDVSFDLSIRDIDHSSCSGRLPGICSDPVTDDATSHASDTRQVYQQKSKQNHAASADPFKSNLEIGFPTFSIVPRTQRATKDPQLAEKDPKLFANLVHRKLEKVQMNQMPKSSGDKMDPEREAELALEEQESFIGNRFSRQNKSVLDHRDQVGRINSYPHHQRRDQGSLNMSYQVPYSTNFRQHHDTSLQVQPHRTHQQTWQMQQPFQQNQFSQHPSFSQHHQQFQSHPQQLMTMPLNPSMSDRNGSRNLSSFPSQTLIESTRASRSRNSAVTSTIERDTSNRKPSTNTSHVHMDDGLKRMRHSRSLEGMLNPSLPPPPQTSQNQDSTHRWVANTSIASTSEGSAAASANTVVLYYFNNRVPFKGTIEGRRVTLAQFKKFFGKKGNFRFFFQTWDHSLGLVVNEEVSEDLDVLPLWEGKIVCTIVSVDEGY